MDCFTRIDKAKKLTDVQKGRIVSLRLEGHQSLQTIAQLAETSVRIHFISFFSSNFFLSFGYK